MRIRAILAAGLVATAGAAHAQVPAPALARPSLIAAGKPQARGLVFFLHVAQGIGVAAVGSARTFGRAELAAAERIELRVGADRRLVAVSRALLLPPGWEPTAGASAASPHLIYALDARPAGVSTLEAEPGAEPAAGQRVRVLGLTQDGARQQERLGRIANAAPLRFEIELDAPASLAGWAGAPVLDAARGTLLGTLEGEPPAQARARFAVTAIGPLLGALERPLENGAGRPFARFAAPALPVVPAGAKLIRPSEPSPTQLEIEVALPGDASAVPPNACGIFVAGHARTLTGGRPGFDVAIVIDTSLSTIEPTGADVNGNGVVGAARLGPVGSLFDAAPDDPGDSILAAEVAAARRLLHQLDPRNTRVALVTFAGELEPVRTRFLFPRSPDPAAVTREPLTRDFARLERALDRLLDSAPAGVTHMAAGVDQATAELLGLPGSRSEPDPRSEKVMLFLTDGQPTLPFGPGRDAENVGAVLDAGERARSGGIRIHTFAIGREALAGPIATVELASRTQGYFIPVREPGELVDVVEAVHFPDLRDVVVRNATTGELAHALRTEADGSFSGFVAGVQGENRLEIVARADDGTSTRREIDVRLDPAAPPLEVPHALVPARNALLEECLLDLTDQRRRAEREHAERVRRELRVEIEREREKARARAAEQRKELRLEIDRD